MTNKLFQYLQGGLTVVATDTRGQKEILSQTPKVGSLIPSNNPVALAQALDNLLHNPAQLNQAKNDVLEIFPEKLCWENQEKILLQQVEKSLFGVRKK